MTRSCHRAVVLASTSAALILGLVATPAAAGPTSGQADPGVALDWQRTALRTVFTEGATPVPASPLYLGFTSLAVDDAVGQRAGSPTCRPQRRPPWPRMTFWSRTSRHRPPSWTPTSPPALRPYRTVGPRIAAQRSVERPPPG